MNPKSNILCVFEGESREGKYFKTLSNVYFEDSSFLVCCYGNDIYELYDEMQDEDLDIVEVLRESKNVPKNAEILAGYDRDDFSQVFLFFDIECQDNGFDGNKFLELTKRFNEETEAGKLFISYPMIEAIRDIPSYETFLDHRVKVQHCKGGCYKALSSQGIQTFNDPRHNVREDWDRLVVLSVEKGNYIISGERDDKSSQPSQHEIAKSQLSSIAKIESLYVLGSFPLFVYHQKPEIFD
ncbi:TPA: hypothetical protein NJ550_002398 [Vibrio parahaemolyticus]|nr:hypothetical protein [Vibrio parahaemolyticus]